MIQEILYWYDSWIFDPGYSKDNRLLPMWASKRKALQDYTDTQFIVLFIPFAISFAIAMDIIIPIIPTLRVIFKTDQASMQLTLSSFMIVLGFGQLLWGPLSDHFGRRTIIIWSAIFYLLGAILCLFAFSVQQLIIYRIIQALGSCGLIVSSFAIVRDLYSGMKSAKFYGYLNGVIAVSPLTAPFIGAFIYLYLGWRAVFGFLTLFAIYTLIVTVFFLENTLPDERRQPLQKLFNFMTILQIIKNPIFFSYVMQVSLASACLFTFFSSSPYYFINILKVPLAYYGFFLCYNSIIFSIGCFIASRFVFKFGICGTALIGCCSLLLCGVLVFIFNYTLGFELISFLLSLSFLGFGTALMISAATGGALQPFEHMAGTASSVLGVFQHGVSGIIGTLILLWPIQNAVPLSILMLVSALMCIGLLLLNRKKLCEITVKS